MAEKKTDILGREIKKLVIGIISSPAFKHAVNTTITGALAVTLAWCGWAPKGAHNHPRPDRSVPAAASTQIPGR
jgi:hypothetical protein